MSQPPERYVPGRPFPARSFIPGETPRPPEPEGTPLDRPADEWRLDEDYLWGVDLYNGGYHWEAHEAWEGLWQAASDRDRRDFLQGLIQCAAAALKASVATPGGARRLAERGTALLEAAAARCGSPFMGLELHQFVAAFRAWSNEAPVEARARPPIRLRVRSRDLPACLTDRRVQPLDAEFLPRRGYAVGRATARDDYYDGQVLVLDRAPEPEAIEERFDDCRREMGGRPIHRLNLVWEDEDEVPWPDAGAVAGVDHYDHLAVLRCDRPPEEAPAPSGIEIRALTRDREWEQLVQLSILLHGEQFGSSFADFARWRYGEFRRTFDAASSHFWGAFHSGRLVGSLGLYETPTLLRFQEVQTHPRHRRQGVCTALVSFALRRAFEKSPRATAIIVADPNTPAERIYRRIGFGRTGSQHWIGRPRRTARALLEAYVSAHNEGATRGEPAPAAALFRPDASTHLCGFEAAPREELELLDILAETDRTITATFRRKSDARRRTGTLALESGGGQIRSLDLSIEKK